MSFLKKGGTGNPFAASAQSGGGGQQPRGSQGNYNAGGRGGGRNPQPHQQQGNQNNYPGGRGGGQTNGNPFAAVKSGGGGSHGAVNQVQQASFQSPNNFGRNQQQPQQNNNFNKQPGSKTNFNPFASGGGGGGSSMEMDGSGGQMSVGFGKQNPPRPQQNAFNSAHAGTAMRTGSGNPFAMSNQQGIGNTFATNTATSGHFGQSSGNGANSNIFGSSAGPGAGFASQQHNAFQNSHTQQGFNGGNVFTQSQQSQSGGRGGHGPPPQSANPFFGGSQHQTQYAVPAAPVRAEVNQQAINAVNMSAALAPSQVEELDLGLGVGLPDTVAPNTASTGQALVPPIPLSSNAGAPVSDRSVDSATQQAAKLLSSILSSCPANSLSDEPPRREEVDKLRSALVAGRISALPPVRTAVSTGHHNLTQLQSNPFNSSGNATRSTFGAV